MDHRIDLFLFEDRCKRRLVQNVRLIECHLFSGDLLHAIQTLLAGITQVIHYNYIVAGLQKLHACVASDKSGAAGN